MSLYPSAGSHSRLSLSLLTLVVAACAGEPVASPHGVGDHAVTLDRSARLASLRAPWQWIGELHHQAMQEALHDPAAAAFTARGPNSTACAAQVRYMERYAPLAAAHSPGESPVTPARIRSLALRVGVCRATSGRTPTAMPAPLSEYVDTLRAQLRAAASLSGALSTIDSTLARAIDDPALSAADLSKLAAISVLAASSATEWYTWAAGNVYQPGSARRTLLVSTSVSPAAVTDDDLDGCIVSGFPIGSLGCAIGAIGGSSFSWL